MQVGLGGTSIYSGSIFRRAVDYERTLAGWLWVGTICRFFPRALFLDSTSPIFPSYYSGPSRL
jgi:hypothetical protein